MKVRGWTQIVKGSKKIPFWGIWTWSWGSFKAFKSLQAENGHNVIWFRNLTLNSSVENEIGMRRARGVETR